MIFLFSRIHSANSNTLPIPVSIQLVTNLSTPSQSSFLKSNCFLFNDLGPYSQKSLTKNRQKKLIYTVCYAKLKLLFSDLSPFPFCEYSPRKHVSLLQNLLQAYDPKLMRLILTQVLYPSWYYNPKNSKDSQFLKVF